MGNDLASEIYKARPMTETASAAHVWRARGWGIVPCQPGTKLLLRGYGPHLEKLESADQIEKWFRFRKCNLAVIAPQNGLILDFDDAELYKRFSEKSPAAGSYTELTPRGGAHVFVEIIEAVDFEPVKGLELKRIGLVYPSVVSGKGYEVAGGKIERVRLQEALNGFGAVKITPPPPSEAVNRSCGQIGGIQGVIEQSKAKWPILTFLAFFAPRLKLTGSGRWRSGLCPWHDDKTPSLWIDSERNTWGCHACPAHGDVVNWWAMAKGKSLGEAAKELLEYAAAVRVEI